MKIVEQFKSFFRNFVRVTSPISKNQSVVLVKTKTEQNMLDGFKLWYQGDSELLNQFYQSMDNQELNFWGVVPSVGLEIPKKHSGLPKAIVDL